MSSSGLTTWAEERIAALHKAKTQAEFDDAFDAFISTDVLILFNGKRITKEGYKQHLQYEHHEGETVEVLFPESVATGPDDCGVVGLFYNVTYKWHGTGDGKENERFINSSITIEVQNNGSNASDPRCAFTIYQVCVEYTGN